MVKETLEEVLKAEQAAQDLLAQAKASVKDINRKAEETIAANHKALLEEARRDAQRSKEQSLTTMDESLNEVRAQGQSEVQKISSLEQDRLEQAAQEILERIINNGHR